MANKSKGKDKTSRANNKGNKTSGNSLNGLQADKNMREWESDEAHESAKKSSGQSQRGTPSM